MDILNKYRISIPGRLDEKLPVLIAEDQQDLRMIVAHQLNKRGFNSIIHASDALEALDLLRQHPEVSIMVCNNEMHSMNGLDLLSEIREDYELSRPPFCISMANVDKAKLMLAVESGVDEILVRPFTLADIVPKIFNSFSSFHNKKNPEKLYELAKVKYREEDYNSCHEIYSHLQISSPSSARPINGLAKIALRQKNYQESLDLLDKAEQVNPHFVNTYALKGEIYFQQGNVAEGLRWYKKAFSISPLNPVHYRNCSHSLKSGNKFEEGIDVLKIALKNGVPFRGIYHLLSLFTYSLKRYDECVTYVQKELNRDPDNIKYLNQLALSYKETNQLEEAVKTYNKVIKLEPKNKQALFNKAILLSQNQRQDEAKKILERLVNMYPDFNRAKEKLDSLTTS